MQIKKYANKEICKSRNLQCQPAKKERGKKRRNMEMNYSSEKE